MTPTELLKQLRASDRRQHPGDDRTLPVEEQVAFLTEMPFDADVCANSENAKAYTCKLRNPTRSERINKDNT